MLAISERVAHKKEQLTIVPEMMHEHPFDADIISQEKILLIEYSDLLHAEEEFFKA